MKLRTILGVVLMCAACAIVFIAAPGCKGKGKEGGGEKIKIGVIVPLTGDIAAMGQGMKNGAVLAVEQANERADVKAKHITFELVPVDDRADPKEAVNGANQLISIPKLAGVVGHLNSGCSIPASSVYARRNLIMISPASTNPKLTQQGLPNVFRVCTTDNVQGSFGADYLYKKRGFTRVAVIHDKTPYGQGLAEEFDKQFKANGGQIISFDGIALGDKDFKGVLTKIKGSSPQAIFFGGMYSEGGLITKQAKELGMAIPLMGGDGINSSEYVKIAGKAADGDISTNPGAPPEKLASAKKFLEDYHKRFPGLDSQPYDAYTFDAANIIIDAAMHVGADPKAIIGYVKTIDFKGVVGDTKFDEKGDTLNKTVTAYIITNGKFVPQD